MDGSRSDLSGRSTIEGEPGAQLERGKVGVCDGRARNPQGGGRVDQSRGDEGALRSGQTQEGRAFGGGEGVCETKRVGREGSGGVGATGERGDVQGVVAVHLAHVATDVEDLGDGFGKVEDVGLEVWDAVQVEVVALVPVVGDGFVAFLPVELWLLLVL